MVNCSSEMLVRVLIVAVIVLPNLIFWIWLMQSAIRSEIHCPEKCWCFGTGIHLTVTCTYASLKTVPLGLQSETRRLNLNHNNITILKRDHFVNYSLTELERLQMDHNELTEVESGAFNGLSKLTYLHLRNNDITTLHAGVFSDLRSLKFLNIAGNNITNIRYGIFRDLEALETLNLADNSIYNVRPDIFIGLRNVKHLELGGNKLTHIDPNVFKHIVNLQYLHLDKNENLFVPSEREFLNISTLTMYSLKECNIRRVSDKSFYLSPKLTYIDLRNNALQRIEVEMLKVLPQLEFLGMIGNPFRCDCRLQEVWHWCRKHNINKGEENPKCYTPEEVSGLSWDVIADATCKDGELEFQGDYKSIKDHSDYDLTYEHHITVLNYLEPSVYILFFIVGTTENIILLIIIGSNKRMRTISNAYIFNLAVGDLLNLIMNLPLSYALVNTNHWPVGKFMCKLTMFSTQLAIGVTGFSVAVLSVQRFYASSGSVHLSTKRATKICIALVWFLAFCYALPSAFSMHVENEGFCTPFHKLSYYQFVVSFQLLAFCITPLCVTVFMYSMTARTLIRRAQLAQEESRTYKTLARIVLGLAVVFFLCFVPYHVLWISFVWDNSYLGVHLYYFDFISLCLIVLSSCLNPLSLYYTSITYRKLFKRYLTCAKDRSKQDNEMSDLPETKEEIVYYNKNSATKTAVL